MGWLGVFQSLLGLIKGKRWRRTAKCKRLIKRLKGHLTIQKSRRIAIVRQSRFDIAQLLKIGLHDIASSRVEQIYKDECKLSAYDQLESFCDIIIKEDRQISLVSISSNNDASEAVSSLIYAASRCGELPELHSIRSQFKKLFGQEFDRVNVLLLPGNNVNSLVKQNLCPIHVKEQQLTNDAAKESRKNLVPGNKKVFDEYFDRGSKEEFLEFSVGNKTEKDQIEAASELEDLMWRIGSKFSLSSNHNVNPVIPHRYSSESNDMTTSDGSPRIQETEIVYLDDLEEQQQVSGKEEPPLADPRHVYSYECGNREEAESCDQDFVPRLSHVHPNLPDYDKLVAKFTHLKKRTSLAEDCFC